MKIQMKCVGVDAGRAALLEVNADGVPEVAPFPTKLTKLRAPADGFEIDQLYTVTIEKNVPMDEPAPVKAPHGKRSK